MDESIPLQLASVNQMEVVAIHMIHFYRHPLGSHLRHRSHARSGFQRVLSEWRETVMHATAIPSLPVAAISCARCRRPCVPAPLKTFACFAPSVVPSIIIVTDSRAWSNRCTHGYCRH
jgi:hypothetical protein